MAGLSDQDRQKLEKALTAALLLLYQGHAQQAMTQLDAQGATLGLPLNVRQQIDAFVRQRAQKIQDGTNQRLDPATRGPADQGKSEDAIKQEIDQHNRAVLIPFLARTMAQWALRDVYAHALMRDGMSAADAHLWQWTQRTDFEDSCADADALGPSSLRDILATSGGWPPRHENCQCSLDPLPQNSKSVPDGFLKKWNKDKPDTVGKLVVAYDLDDTALQMPQALVPLAWAIKDMGGELGIISGNKTIEDKHGDARQKWDQLGYPKPDFIDTRHDFPDVSDYAQFKADACQARGVTLMVDDFMRGQAAHEFLERTEGHPVALQVLVPKSLPPQHVKGLKAQRITRSTSKYAVPAPAVPRLVKLMTERLGPDPFDPQFRGQTIRSVYYDTPSGDLLAHRKAKRDYVTLRLRHYAPSDVWYLEAKDGDSKYRERLDPDTAQRLMRRDPTEAVKAFLPEVADRLMAITHGTMLHPKGAVSYQRFARQTEGERMTLDLELGTDDGRRYQSPLLEYKITDAFWPAIDVLDLGCAEVSFSKFLWRLEG